MTLLKDTNIRSLFASVTLSAIGDWAFQVAMIFYIYQTTESAIYVSALMLTSAIPGLVLSSVVTRVVAKLSLKKVLIFADIARALLVLALIAVVDHIDAILMLNVIIGIFSVAFRTAYVQTITIRFDSSIRHKVNALLNIGSFVSMGIGAALGASFLVQFSIITCLLFNSFSFVISGICLLYLQSDKADEINNIEQSNNSINLIFFNDLKNNTMLKSVLLFGLSWGIVGGAFTILIPIMLLSGQTDADNLGLFYFFQAIALIIGSTIVYRIDFSKNTRRLVIVFIVAYFIQALSFSSALISNSIPLMIFLLMVMRISGGIIIPLDTTIIQNNCTGPTLSMFYNIHSLTYTILFQSAILLIGLLVDNYGIDFTCQIMAYFSSITIGFISLYTYFSYVRSNSSKGTVNV
ncbi:MFS transporter [Candidatus Sororendozoicomonas aggregata]|uniref:MFS transporter n=1 Tax=Candidatus Sororendozoicomonas aggregata TaxID=3073239 RepID=UPI002ED4EC27